MAKIKSSKKQSIRNQHPEKDTLLWEEKYKVLLQEIPFALIEINNEVIVNLTESAKQLLNIDTNISEIILSDVFSETEILLKKITAKEKRFSLIKDHKNLVFNYILSYSPANHIYHLEDSSKDKNKHSVIGTSDFQLDLFRSFTEHSALGVCVFNDKGIIVEWNQSMSDMYEVAPEVYLNKPVWEFDYDYLPVRRKTSKEKERIKDFIINYVNKPKKPLFEGEFEQQIHDRAKYIQYQVFPIQTESGFLFGRINIDVSEKKASEIELLEYKDHLEDLFEKRTLELQKSETRLQLLLQSIPMAYYSYDLSNRKNIWYSDQIESLTGFNTEDFRKNPNLWVERINPEDYELVGGTFDKLCFNRQRASCEYRWKDARDQEIWMLDQAVLIEATDRHPQQVVGCFMDITDRKKTENAIIESEQTHREIYNATSEAIIVHNYRNGKILDVNNAMLNMFGYTYEEALNITFEDFSSGIGEYTYDQAIKLITQTVKKGPKVVEWQAKRRDGTLFWIEISLKIAEINGQKRVLSVIRDISERKKAAEILRESEEKYRLLIEGQTDLIVKMDIEGHFLFVSPSYCEIFGKTEEELLGSTFFSLVHKDDRDLTLKTIRNISKPPYACYIEQRASTKHGLRWLAWSDKAILNEKNEVIEIIGIGRDITYQKDVEEALRLSEARFRSIVQQLSDIVFILDGDFQIVYDTPSIKGILGYNEGSLVGKSIFDILLPDDKKSILIKINQIKKKKDSTITIEARVQKSNGEYIPSELVFINLLHLTAINGIVLTLRDISERKLLDKKVLDAVIKTEEQERERFAKNLHDDLGPLLSSIKMYLGLMKTTDQPEKQEYVITQLNEIVKEAITTTKEVSNDLSPHILINYGLASAIETFIQKIPLTIKVNFQCSLPSERYSNTIENSFYRIIKELINNTVKHSEANRIDITLEEKGQNLDLSYTDNGKGFDLENYEKGKKTGMGISNIISRAKSLNGVHELYTSINSGFSFHITIPIHQSFQ